MTNHLHLLLTPEEDQSISRCMQHFGTCYVRYFNHRYKRSDTLFEGRYKSSLIQCKQYLLACQRYIELNSVRAGMAADPADYSWSSYRAHAFGMRPAMWQPHPEYLALGRTPSKRMTTYRQLTANRLTGQQITDIRNALNTGLVLGNEQFKEEIRQLTGHRQHHRKRGPKK